MEERNCSLNARQESEKSQGTGVCGKKFKGRKLRGPTAPSLAQSQNSATSLGETKRQNMGLVY